MILPTPSYDVDLPPERHCCVAGSPLQQRPHPVLLPLAGARVQDEAGGETVAVTIFASTGGDLLPLSSSHECDMVRPLAWQGGRGAAAGRRKNFRR